MKTITSKNTWYFIFGFLFILLISLVIYRSMFGPKKDQLDTDSSLDRSSYINDTSEEDVLTEQISPFDSPATGAQAQVENQNEIKNNEDNLSEKRGLALFPDIIKVSPTPSSSSKTPSIADSTKAATKSSNLKIITDKNGTTFVSTENSDGSVDTTQPKKSEGVIFTLFKLPAGYATDIGTLINDLLRLILVVAALLVFGQLIWGGINWITSGGDKTKTEAARAKIVAAVVGLIVVASSFAILQLTLTFLGISSLNELLQTSFQTTTSALQEDETATTSAIIIIDENENNGENKTKGEL